MLATVVIFVDPLKLIGAIVLLIVGILMALDTRSTRKWKERENARRRAAGERELP